jgi:hypothetical protein
MKLKRQAIHQKYAAEIETLYPPEHMSGDRSA